MRFIFAALASLLFFALPALSQEPYVPSWHGLPNSMLPPKIYRGELPKRFDVPNRWFQGIASVAEAADGSLWCCWYGGSGENTNNYVLVAYSTDGGDSWSAPIRALDWPGPVRVYDPTIWRGPDDRLWLFWAQSDGENNDGRQGVWRMSTDETAKGAAADWNAPRRLCNGIMMDKPTVDSSGRWLLPSASRTGSRYRMEPEFSGAGVYVSTDRLETADFLGGVAIPEGDRADEHTIVEL